MHAAHPSRGTNKTRRSSGRAASNREPGVIKALRARSLLSKAHQIRRTNAAVYNSLAGVLGVLLTQQVPARVASGEAKVLSTVAPADGVDAETLRNPQQLVHDLEHASAWDYHTVKARQSTLVLRNRCEAPIRAHRPESGELRKA